ncbi:GNAT family N-acetyltransferase [Mucilaginibacter sp. Bleaf8]|nr:GNAT family N-acetyltransferase [Mucilaginibacter sp. Bleaf8]
MHAMEMEEDKQGLHFGAFTDDKLVGVISLFQNGVDFQFRKFAVAPGLQGQGIGSLMLQHITGFVQQQGGKRLWCNARTTAISFYLRAGFHTTGQTFERKSVSFEILEKLF